jgi:hypothetical protein
MLVPGLHARAEIEMMDDLSIIRLDYAVDIVDTPSLAH